jgi:hypothetical protein
MISTGGRFLLGFVFMSDCRALFTSQSIPGFATIITPPPNCLPYLSGSATIGPA